MSMAALDPNPPFNFDVNKSQTISLWLQHNKAEFLLCTLEYGKLYQQPLDYIITEGEEITFFVTGQGVIHLTGFLIEEDMTLADESLEEKISSDDSEDSEDMPALINPEALAKVNKKRTKDMKTGSKKKRKVENQESDQTSSESDSADEDYDEVDDDSEDAPTEESDDDSDYTEATSKRKKSKLSGNQPEKSAPKQNPKKSSNPKEQNVLQKSKKNKKNLASSMQSVEEDALSKSLIDAALSSEKKKKKKKKKAVKTAQETSSSCNSSNNKSDLSTSSDQTKSNVATFSSGLVVEDLQVGQGAEARIGRQVHVYYSGKLAKNGKMFDCCVSGKPFRFTLGKGEVISGWEKGLLGLRVGGKRRLTIPSKLGYGSQKIGPIPPHSSLIFDIELKGIS